MIRKRLRATDLGVTDNVVVLISSGPEVSEENIVGPRTRYRI